MLLPILRDTFNYLLKAPAFILTQRAAFNNLDTITYFGAVKFIVNLILYATFNILAVDTVLNETVDFYNNSLFHLVAHNNTYLSFSVTAFTHFDTPPALLSVRMVLI